MRYFKIKKYIRSLVDFDYISTKYIFGLEELNTELADFLMIFVIILYPLTSQCKGKVQEVFRILRPVFRPLSIASDGCVLPARNYVYPHPNSARETTQHNALAHIQATFTCC